MKLEDSELLKDIEQVIAQHEKREKQKPAEAPIATLEQIRKDRTQEGVGELVLGGVPIDVHSIESLLIKISPLEIKTILRYNDVKATEQVLNTTRPQTKKKSDFNWTLIIILIVAIVGIVIFGVLILPKILAMVGVS